MATDPVLGPQDGRFRTIHPVGSAPLHVGRPDDLEVLRMETTGAMYTVEEDGTRLSRNKQFSVEFRKGQQITAAEAYDYGFTDEAGAPAFARPADEKPDIAPTEQRSLGAAPENRADAPKPKK